MIEVLKFRSHTKGALLGFADIFIDKTGMEIYGCTMYQKDGRRWVNLPQKEYEENGEKKYAPVVRFRNKAHQTAFQDQALDAIDEWCAQNAASVQEEEPPEAFQEEEGIPF